MLEIDACVLTHCGKVRSNNEDSVRLVRPHDNAHQESQALLAIVADGMGGHEGGELASRLAVDSIANSYSNSPLEFPAVLEAGLMEANRAIYHASLLSRKLRGMGTTCVIVALWNEQAWWAWVGDSRLYLLRNQSIYQLTEDHTVVQDLVRRGMMTREQARDHRDRSVLERALGTHDQVEPGLSQQPLTLTAGDRLLLCSDGLHDLVEDSELTLLACSGSVSEGAQNLLELALEHGGHDNISIILLEANQEQAAEKRCPVKTREHVSI